MRNEISHEYSMRDISEIFEDVLNFSATLKDILKSAQSYIDKKFPEDEEAKNQEEDAG